MAKLLYIDPLVLKQADENGEGEVRITTLKVSDDFPTHNMTAAFKIGELAFQVSINAIQTGSVTAMQYAEDNHAGKPYFLDLTAVQ